MSPDIANVVETGTIATGLASPSKFEKSSPVDVKISSPQTQEVVLRIEAGIDMVSPSLAID
jgi:hypothetical protein